MEVAKSTTGSVSAQGAQWKNVHDLLRSGVEEGIFPGAVLLVGTHGKVMFHQAVGNRCLPTHAPTDALATASLEMRPDTIFDIGNLTGLVGTTTLLMKMVESNQIHLNDRISRYIHGFGTLGKSPVTIGHLLSHTSGLSAHEPFFETLLEEHAGARMGIITSRGARDYVFNAINRSSLKYEMGSRQVPSELGFMVLGNLIEDLTGLSLDRALYRFVFQPLGLKSTSFIDLALLKRRGISPVTELIAPTEECLWRKRTLCGEVFDDNAWAMGGIAGHAGLFSSAFDLHRFATEILSALRGASSFLKRETVQVFLGSTGAHDEWSYRYGWDTPSRENLMTDAGFGPSAVGESSQTGCSLWLEPETGLSVVLLTNRVHPSRKNLKIRQFRPLLHAAIMKSVK